MSNYSSLGKCFWLTRTFVFVVLAIMVVNWSGGVSAETLPSQPQPITDKTPAYFYDHETAFVIEYSIDATNGGMYLALDPATNQPFGTINDNVYGNLAAEGTDKHAIGHGVCIRYFIQEYQRIADSGEGVIGINSVLGNQINSAISLTAPTDLLNYAQSCADFVIDHMVIPVDDGITGGNEDCVGDMCTTDSDQGDMATPNMAYLYASTNQDGTARLQDETGIPANLAAARAESSIVWSMVELAHILKEVNGNTCGADCQTYVNFATDYWTWRHTTALPTPVYNSINTQVGVARDVFYPALGFLLTEVTGDTSYRDGGGSTVACPSGNNADGTACGAIPFLDSILGTGNAPDAPYPFPHALQDGSYIAGYGRAIAFTLHEKNLPSNGTDRDQWWDFGSYPLIDYGSTSNLRDPLEVAADTTADYGVAFAHFNGREVLVGTQRAAMFFRNSGVNQNIWWANGTGQTDIDFANMAVTYWDFINNNMWDDTSGQRSWYESSSLGYKPCFSAGTEIPFADSQAPAITGIDIDFVCGSNGLGENDIDITVNTTDLTNSSRYLSWEFDGFGIDTVELLWTCDPAVAAGGDATAFNSLPLTGAEPAYSGVLDTASIQANCANTDDLFYYTKAVDVFGNESSFSPNGTPETNTTAEDWWTTRQATVTTDALTLGRITCPPITVTIGDQIWYENDGDGDASTNNIGPAPGIVVTVTALDGTVYSDTTDANGQYTVTVPANSTYTVTVAIPAGSSPSTTVATGTESDSNINDNLSHNPNGAIVQVTDQNITSLDFGLTLEPTAVDFKETPALVALTPEDILLTTMIILFGLTVPTLRRHYFKS